MTGIRGGSMTSSPNVMSLFSREEKHYERYAAALAATEPLRKQRDIRAKQTLRPFEFFFLKRRGKLSGGKGICDLGRVDPNRRNARLRVVCSGHVKTMSSVIRALGMTVPEFNTLSREVSEDTELRARVMQQAYYYRVAAELSKSAAAFEEIPDFMKQQQQQQQQQQTTAKADGTPVAGGAGASSSPRPMPQVPPKKLKSKPMTIPAFAKVTHRIEALRQKQEKMLKRELKIENMELPPGICGAAYSPLLNSKVRGICLNFPVEAQKVVEDYGVELGRFNAMLARADRNLILRWRVRRVLRKAQTKARKYARDRARTAEEAAKMARVDAAAAAADQAEKAAVAAAASGNA
jgi:hypothetical protein